MSHGCFDSLSCSFLIFRDFSHDPNTQFARLEFSVFEFGVSSSIAAAIYQSVVNEQGRDASSRQCDSNLQTETLKTPDVKLSAEVET
jgi:hypothetical protein